MNLSNTCVEVYFTTNILTSDLNLVDMSGQTVQFFLLDAFVCRRLSATVLQVEGLWRKS